MNAVSISSIKNNAASKPMTMHRVLGAYVAEARSECLRYLRNPGFMLPIMLFPTMFYLLFGIVMAGHEGKDVARYLLGSYSVFGVMSPGLFGFGISLALERDGGLLTYKRALPMPPGAYLLGKMLMAMLAAAVVVTLLLGMSVGVAHVSLTATQAVLLLTTGVLGVLPFCALGMLVGTLIKGQGAPGLLNLIYLPMSFLSGLWVPLNQLPNVLQRIAPVWPSTHLHSVALAALGMRPEPVGSDLVYLAVFALVCFLIAARRLQRVG